MHPVASFEFGTDYEFEDVFPDASAFAGVKAVSGPMIARYLCFGKNGASTAAAMASKAPWAICIGSSDAWDAKHKGRVLNLVRMTTSHQDTRRFASSEAERAKFQRWPEAVAVGDVFELVDAPRVKDDLALAVHPLLQAHDKVSALTPGRMPIVAALRRYGIRLVDLPPLPSGITLGTVVPAAVSFREGQEIVRTAREIERSPKLAKLVKSLNMAENGGEHVCEGCGFRDVDAVLFDAHHRRPVHVGVQETTPALMSVLCPTCHRVVHRKAEKAHLPMEIKDLRTWHADRGAAAVKAAAD